MYSRNRFKTNSQYQSYDINKVKTDFLKVNFGDIDGRSDPKLTEYFFDRDYWNKIVVKYKYFVIGRKGTGKSALYNWLNTTAYKTGNICHNILFNDFPMGELLSLNDDTFLKPNQYQTICKNMILSEFCKIVAEDGDLEINDSYDIIYRYNKLNNSSIEDCFRKTVSIATKENGKLKFPSDFFNLSATREQTDSYDMTAPNLQSVNTTLETALINYFKCYSKQKKFIIQIDGIDENYTQIISMDDKLDDYFGFIISLLKTVYAINQRIHLECNDIAKCIVYIRSDIMERIHKIDAESARWTQQTELLNWSIGKESSWYDNDLRSLINKRIQSSISIPNKDGFEYLFNNYIFHVKIGNHYFNNLFEYMGIRSFHRPRDIIQFCISIQNSIQEFGVLSAEAFENGEKAYSLWFLSEITNEISPVIKDTDTLFAMLRTLGGKPLSITTFKKIYSKYSSVIGLDAEALLRYLYELGVIYNIDDNKKVFTSIRNYQSKLNPDMKIGLHAGFWKGLYTSTYYGK